MERRDYRFGIRRDVGIGELGFEVFLDSRVLVRNLGLLEHQLELFMCVCDLINYFVTKIKKKELRSYQN